MSTGWTGLVARATARLAAVGVPSPRVDAEVLAAYVAGVPRGRLIVCDAPTSTDIEAFELLVARRSRREPLQHILGSVPFRWTDVAVGPGVFIPRPETELLVEWVLAALAPTPSPTLVDLCAGSGAIALALAHERPDATVHAVERDADAWPWLRRNVESTQVRAVHADAVAASTLADLDSRCDAVVSNPPYVPSAVPVEPEVAADPAQAVFGGGDGLDVIRPLTRRVAALLRPGGVTAIEHDDSHAKAVADLLTTAGLVAVESHRDLAGKPRFTTARRAADVEATRQG